MIQKSTFEKCNLYLRLLENQMIVEHNTGHEEPIDVDVMVHGCSLKEGGENKMSTCLYPPSIKRIHCR